MPVGEQALEGEEEAALLLEGEAPAKKAKGAALHLPDHLCPLQGAAAASQVEARRDVPPDRQPQA